MAPNSALTVLALLLVLSSSAAASERLQPELAAGCWKEICQVPNCLFSILEAFFFKSGGGGSSPIDAVGVPCCAAFLTLTGDCKVEIFQNSSVITLIQTFCSAIVPPQGAPAPENGGDMPWPWPKTPAAPGPWDGGDVPWPEPPAAAPGSWDGGDVPWPEPPAAAPGPGGDEDDVGASFRWSTVRFV